MVQRKEAAFTLVELIITMVIIAILTVISTVTLMGYLPKHRLSATARTMEMTLQRAQSEAQGKGLMTAVHFYNSGGQCYYQLCYDDAPSSAPDSYLTLSGGGGNQDTCRTATPCGANITLVSRSNCGNDASVLDANAAAAATTDGSVIYFKPDGQCYSYNGASLDNKSWQIFLRSSDLDKSANEKEIEVLETGLISLPKADKPGYMSLQADLSCSGE